MTNIVATNLIVLDPGTQTDLINQIVAYVLGAAAQHPYIATIMILLGVGRSTFKPLCLILEWVCTKLGHPDQAQQVASVEAKVEASMAWKIFSWLIDLLLSVKTSTVAKTVAVTTAKVTALLPDESKDSANPPKD